MSWAEVGTGNPTGATPVGGIANLTPALDGPRWIPHVDDVSDQRGSRRGAKSSAARALRGDVDGALAFAKQHGEDVIADLASVLDTHGKDAAADRALALLEGDALAEVVTDIVKYHARRGELEAAATRARGVPPRQGELHPMIHVLREAAVRGQISKVRELGRHYPGTIDGFLGIAASVLARVGSCDVAVPAARDVRSERGATLAVIARYCPDSRL